MKHNHVVGSLARGRRYVISVGGNPYYAASIWKGGELHNQGNN